MADLLAGPVSNVGFRLAGIFFLLFSIYSLLRFLKLKHSGIRARAVVKEIVQFGNRAYKYFPVLEYTALGGETVVKRSYVGGRRDNYHIGDEIEIVYDRERPRHFLLWAGFNKYWKIIGSFILGAAFILAGL